jgi:hypothetical protein
MAARYLGLCDCEVLRVFGVVPALRLIEQRW